MVYLTGDTHGSFLRLRQFCTREKTAPDDTLIILGDAGFNVYANDRDVRAKQFAAALPVTLFCIHGNHERRPSTLPSYREREYRGGTVWYEEAYPNLLFAKDGEIYDFDGKKCIVIGGAYSVDKYYRLAMGYFWSPDEQPSPEIRRRVEEKLDAAGWKVDAVLSHTCPVLYEPTEVFLKSIDRRSVDKSTERWLGELEERLRYERWYCGHFHIAKKTDRLQFMFEDYAVLCGADCAGV